MTYEGTRRDFLRNAGLGMAAVGLAGAGLCGRGAAAHGGLAGALAAAGQTAPAAQAPRGRPNIVIIMADDMGYSDIGCYGGEIATPHLDALAAGGLRYTQFYNAARCCPTRASLLTGLYPHQAGMGGMVSHAGQLTTPENLETGPYQGYLNDSCVTIAEALRPAGYRTYMTGKWHVGEFRPVWPVDRGFDRHYGLLSGAMNYFGDRDKLRSEGATRGFAEDDKAIWPDEPGWYATDAFTDRAVAMLEAHPANDPFFLYVAHTAPHWPLHAWEEDVLRYERKYLMGWAELRRRRFEKQRQLGVIDPAWELSPPDPEAADWDELDRAMRTEMDRKMAVYAAQVDRLDQNIGRLVAQLKRMGVYENTLILFLSDNGACHESGPFGRDFRPDLTGPIGTANSFHSYGRSWSNAGNTPVRLHKHWVHEGGCATPLIAHWPAGIQARGALRGQTGHIIDLMPTCLELAGAAYPEAVAGKPITPLEGASLVPSFNSADTQERELYWEHMGNRAVRRGDWKLVARREEGIWELYNLAEDRTETRNLINDRARIADELTQRWESWGQRVGVEER